MKSHHNIHTLFGSMIHSLVQQDDIKTIVEIGTGSGLGTTKCIRDGLSLSNKTDYSVISLESNKMCHQEAIANNGVLPSNFKIIYGRIIDMSELNWFDNKSLTQSQKTYLEMDMAQYKDCPYVLDKIPESIDLLILDGGEYSSYVEFKKISDRAKIIALDDTYTKTMKNVKSRLEILNQPEKYEVMVDSLTEKNGCMIVRRIS